MWKNFIFLFSIFFKYLKIILAVQIEEDFNFSKNTLELNEEENKKRSNIKQSNSKNPKNSSYGKNGRKAKVNIIIDEEGKYIFIH